MCRGFARSDGPVVAELTTRHALTLGTIGGAPGPARKARTVPPSFFPYMTLISYGYAAWSIELI